jgi:hypothetical protein
MAVQDGEKGGNDLLVAVEFTVAAGESGINIKNFHVPTQLGSGRKVRVCLTRPVFLSPLHPITLALALAHTTQ